MCSNLRSAESSDRIRKCLSYPSKGVYNRVSLDTRCTLYSFAKPPGRQPIVFFYLQRIFPSRVYTYDGICCCADPGFKECLHAIRTPRHTPLWISIKVLKCVYEVLCPSGHREAPEEVGTALEGSAATAHTSRAVGASGSLMNALMTRLCHFIQRF